MASLSHFSTKLSQQHEYFNLLTQKHPVDAAMSHSKMGMRSDFTPAFIQRGTVPVFNVSGVQKEGWMDYWIDAASNSGSAWNLMRERIQRN